MLPDPGTTAYNLSKELLAYELHTRVTFHFDIQNTFTHLAEVAIIEYHIDGFTQSLCNLSSRAFTKKSRNLLKMLSLE